jgi:hypothetical protein
MRTCIKILFFLLLPFGLHAQVDSLRKLLSRTVDGQVQYNLCGDIYNYYEERNRDSALVYAEKRIAIARKYGRKIPEGYSLISKAYQLCGLGRLGETYRCLLDAFTIADDPAIPNDEDWQMALVPFKGDANKKLIRPMHTIYPGY